MFRVICCGSFFFLEKQRINLALLRQTKTCRFFCELFLQTKTLFFPPGAVFGAQHLYFHVFWFLETVSRVVENKICCKLRSPFLVVFFEWVWRCFLPLDI